MTHALDYRFITKLKANIKVELFKCNTKRRVTKNNKVMQTKKHKITIDITSASIKTMSGGKRCATIDITNQPNTNNSNNYAL